MVELEGPGVGLVSEAAPGGVDPEARGAALEVGNAGRTTKSEKPGVGIGPGGDRGCFP